jgi:NADH-quinone oxidoreductase subunit M
MTAIAGTSIILGAIYMLNIYREAFFGVPNEKNSVLKDLNGRELTALVPLVAIVIWLGVYPKPVLGPIDTASKGLVNFMYHKAVAPETKATLVEVNTIQIKGAQ